jgi:hypothetical protein
MQNIPHHRTPRAIPWRGLVVVAGLALSLCLFLALRSTFDPLTRQEAARQAERAAQLDDRLLPVDLFVAALLRLAPPMLGLGLFGAAGYIGLVIAYRRWADHRYIEAAHITALTQAQAQRFPAGLQHLSFHDSSRPQLAPAVEVEETRAALTSPTPTFGQLLDQGAIGQGRPLLLGYDAATGMPIEGSWERLYTAGIGGLQGSGKTWAAVFLLAQSALQGAKFIICDPHAHDAQSLAARLAPLRSALLCDVASDDKAILAALQLADSKLQGRKSGQIAGRWPIVVAIDEWLALRRGKLADQLPPLVEGYSTEGRKLGCYALLLAQRWDKDAVGDFRNTLASSYVYRMRADEARMMTGLRGAAVPDDTIGLAPGECYLLDTYGDCRKVVIPQMTPHDITRIGELLSAQNKPPIGYRLPPTAPLPSLTPAASIEAARRSGGEAAHGRAASTASGSATSRTPEQARALALFQGGMGQKEAIKAVWNVDGGTRYQKLAAELNDLIRQAMHEGS